ncbi:hypothetical protein DFH11DRAFT_1630903 [Phellopilus nigrolimitatus]|nr:hypothetical protein DFH11DRAFT_1630903 [Phellopilus nigrolimitatus]
MKISIWSNLPKDGQRANDASHLESASRPSTRRTKTFNLTRIPKLLMLGYPSEESQRRYELESDWSRLYTILMFKIENIGIVSGLLLASSCNLLIAGDLRRMTHASVSASMYGSILSIVFGLLCRINITPGRLQFLVGRTRLFYYLYATPSLWGGGAALAFFVAICSFTWLEESTAKYGWEAKISAVVLSAALIGNAVACFVLGARVMALPGQNSPDENSGKVDGSWEEKNTMAITHLEERQERMLAGDKSFGVSDWSANLTSPFDALSNLVSSDTTTSLHHGPSRSATFDSSASVASPRRAHVRVPSRRETAW